MSGVDPLTQRAYDLLRQLEERIADAEPSPIRAAAIADLEAAREYYWQCAYALSARRASHALTRWGVPASDEPSSYQVGVVEVDGRDTGEGIGRYR